MKALYILGCFAILYACSACGSTIRLDYSGKGGSGGVGITFPDSKPKNSTSTGSK